MGLTLETEQKLLAAELVDFYDKDPAPWIQSAQNAYNYVESGFPPDSVIRPDDVAKALRPVVEVHEELKAHLAERKLRQKYWIGYFVDLIVDRTWTQLREIST